MEKENALEQKLREKNLNTPGIWVYVTDFCLSFGLGFYAEPVVTTFLPYLTLHIPKRYYPELTVVTFLQQRLVHWICGRMKINTLD